MIRDNRLFLETRLCCSIPLYRYTLFCLLMGEKLVSQDKPREFQAWPSLGYILGNYLRVSLIDFLNWTTANVVLMSTRNEIAVLWKALVCHFPSSFCPSLLPSKSFWCHSAKNTKYQMWFVIFGRKPDITCLWDWGSCICFLAFFSIWGRWGFS